MVCMLCFLVYIRERECAFVERDSQSGCVCAHGCISETAYVYK